jgi:hypothetical protein
MRRIINQISAYRVFGRDRVVYAKPPFAGPQQVLDYVGYTHIGSPSPTIGWSTWRTATSASGTRITAPTVRSLRRRWRCLRWNSSDGFSCTRYRRASTVFGTSACLGIGTGRRSSPDAGSCWTPRAPKRSRPPRCPPRTIAIGTRSSPASPCARARSVVLAAVEAACS